MKKLVFSVLVFVLLLGIAGCGAKSEVIYGGIDTPAIATATSAPDALKHSYGLDQSNLGKGEEATGPQVKITTPPMTTVASVTDTSTGVRAAILPTERMVIMTASLSLVVEDVSVSLQNISDLAKVNGGYVVNSNIREDKSRLYAGINFRVTADKFNDTILALKKLAVDVRSETTSGQDVTEQYIDLDAQLRNLEASESQLLALMNKAGSVEEILKVQVQLSSTRGQIEQIKGRMQYLQQSSSLSSISVSLEQSKLSVEFSATATTIKEGNSIRFTPVISGGFQPYSFEWDFGDGKTSTESAPIHSYKKAGTYTVKLSIKDDKGSTTDITRGSYITVLTGWAAGNTASSAWNGLVAFGRFLVNFLIWIGILSPIWIVILVVLYFTIWRRRKKKS
jgi:PKD repeat protein